MFLNIVNLLIKLKFWKIKLIDVFLSVVNCFLLNFVMFWFKNLKLFVDGEFNIFKIESNVDLL